MYNVIHIVIHNVVLRIFDSENVILQTLSSISFVAKAIVWVEC